jgi:hypothetical protein
LRFRIFKPFVFPPFWEQHIIAGFAAASNAVLVAGWGDFRFDIVE